MHFIFIRFFRRKRAHHRTSHKKSNDDDYGGRLYHTAKENSYIRVSFGCFIIYKRLQPCCRSPPFRLDF